MVFHFVTAVIVPARVQTNPEVLLVDTAYIPDKP